MLRIGLTGGIASGKTTIADYLGELGAQLVDADIIAREVVEPGTEGLKQVVATFGTDILDSEGALDRRKLRERVFADPTQRQRLEGIVHPLIRAEVARQM